jgi:transcriptional regulator with XRE-family HTH domain
VTGEALKTGREEANMTQQEAASKLGLTQAYLSMLERGRRPVRSCCAGNEGISSAAYGITPPSESSVDFG